MVPWRIPVVPRSSLLPVATIVFSTPSGAYLSQLYPILQPGDYSSSSSCCNRVELRRDPPLLSFRSCWAEMAVL